jgi:two-component system KDP operon response regulator KdpE
LAEWKKGSLASRPEILLIEDDPQIRKFLRAILIAEDYRLFEAATGNEGLAQAASRNPDLILLDLGLPDKDGIEVIGEIRRWSQVPILILSARDRERDKIDALDSGADDYVTKPFVPGEVLARIRASLRRAAVLDKDEPSSTVRFGNISVNLSARRVLVDGSEVHLTPNEFKVLQVLIRHAGQVVTHRQLLNQVWGPEHLGEAQYLRVFVGQLRRKLEADPAHPQHLITEPGVGYRLLVDM